MAIIVIDPGHGGWTTIPGDSTWNNAVGPNGTLEKNLTLDIGLRTRAALMAMGHDARLTRATDVNMRLRDRAAVARNIAAHAFVSIHFNGSNLHNAQGTETLVHLSYSSRSAALSLAVQDSVLAVTGLTDRNRTYDPVTRIKPQALGVLRPDRHHPGTAACLVEVSFLDRADEETRLQNPNYRGDIAQAIARGVHNHVGGVAPALEMDVGDAIEAEAVPAGQTIPAYLDIDASTLANAVAPAAGTADIDEKIKKPPKLFSSAFVAGGAGANALIPAAPAWPDLAAFEAFIQALNLNHFEPDEFLFLGASNAAGQCAGLNTFPPRALWNNITNTALMINAIRKEMGAPIRILSCYRSPAYNDCISGATHSQHVEFNAIDFTCGAGTPEVWRRVAAELRSQNGNFMGGIGKYSSFVHIDTRGHQADWVG